MQNLDSIDSIELDSLKVRIPLKEVEIINKGLNAKWLLVNQETGETDTNYFKENSFPINENGIKTRFAIEKQKISFKEAETFLIILFNSKILKERYLEGITIDNIKEVYQKLISYGVVKFSFDSFMFAECTDVDFKRDTIRKHFKDITKSLFQLVKESKVKNEGAQLFNRADNIGIEFSARDTTSFLKNPFLKIYHKGLELRNNSKEFFGAYLFGVIPDEKLTDRIRIEYTIKNKKHFRYFKVNDTTLKNILELTEEKKKEMLRSILNNHLQFERVEITMHRNELTPTEIVILGLIEANLQMNLQYNYLIEEILKGIENKTQRSRKRVELRKLYDTYLKGQKSDIKAESFGNFLDWLTTA